MLSISDIATMFNISYQQVNDLVEYGYLAVAKIERHKQRGIRYLFAEDDVCQLDVHSHLAEIKALHSKYHYPVGQKTSDFKKRLRAIDRYASFLENIQDYPEAEVLRACFFLFHLNHYAKSLAEQLKDLYRLKSRHTGPYIDQMYLYGRSVTRVEEKVFPLLTVIEELNQYLQIESVEG